MAVNLIGSDNANLIQGFESDDTINVLGGNDTVYGAGGNDTIDAGAGDDFVNGNQGNDIIDGLAGNDTLRGGKGIDGVIGGDGNDFLYGDFDSDVVYGGTGNDYLRGGKGDDLVWGGDGNDYIAGDLGNDVLWGDDSMLGFAFSSGADTFAIGANTGQDTIMDFQGAGVAGGDILQISSAVKANAAAVLSSTHTVVEGGVTSLVVDLGGGNTVTLLGVASLSADDISIA
ncbi:MAG: 5-Nucleotidase domain protein [Rickettsiales bacterium]|jgi:Ca2+-binding RTX toxin-like protein|nr:5-Nucleotidase domain protein [Rickettsiales bacterium]